MYNLNFDNLKSAMESNKLSEKELVHALKQYFGNQNYRAEYNQRKNALNKALASDPVIMKRREELGMKKTGTK